MSHDATLSLPSRALYVPAAHSSHTVALAAAYDPRAHGVQTPAPAALNVPATQSTHVDDPATADVPAAHTAQSLSTALPVFAFAFPAAHSLQFASPASSA